MPTTHSGKRSLSEIEPTRLNTANSSKKPKTDEEVKLGLFVTSPDYEKDRITNMQDAMRERGLPVEGLKADLVDILQRSDWQTVMKKAVDSKNYGKLLHCELKNLASARQLKVSGSRYDLVQRLEEADHKSSLAVKRKREKIAQSRREAAGIRPDNFDYRSMIEYDDMLFSEKQHELVMRLGPSGPPVFDRMGYKLDYEKIAKYPSFRSRPSFQKREAMMLRREREEAAKRALMGIPSNKANYLYMDYWVAQDLGIPSHGVEVCDYEEWKRAGFQCSPEEVLALHEQRDWITGLSIGCVFRE